MRIRNFYLIILLIAILNVFACLAYADDYKIPDWMPKVLGMQFNEIYQNMPDFHSPYEGPNSLTTDNNKGHGSTQIYGLYLGSGLPHHFRYTLISKWLRETASVMLLVLEPIPTVM